LGHGFRNNSGFTLSPQVRTAAEDFRQTGYRTAAFVSGFPLDRRFGFDRGFETYDDHLPRGNDRRRTPYVERFADATTDATIRVPWVMAGPGIPAGYLSRTVARSIDVLPTLADYAGLGRLNDVDGRSLRAAADGQEMSDAPSYAESLYPEMELGWAPLFAWRIAGLKFI